MPIPAARCAHAVLPADAGRSGTHARAQPLARTGRSTITSNRQTGRTGLGRWLPCDRHSSPPEQSFKPESPTPRVHRHSIARRNEDGGGDTAPAPSELPVPHSRTARKTLQRTVRCRLRVGTRAMSRSLPGTRIYSRPSGLPLYSNPAVGWKTAPTGDRRGAWRERSIAARKGTAARALPFECVQGASSAM